MPYASEGTLTTDEREIAISETWGSQTDWTAYQSASNIVVNNGVVSLAEVTAPPAVSNNATDWYPYREGSGTTVANGLGSVNITLNNGGTWQNDTRFYDGTAASFDGVDDYYVANSLGVNGTQFSVAGWIEVSSHEDYARVMMGGDTTDPSTTPSNGWDVFFDAGSNDLRVRVYNGGTGTGAMNGFATIPSNDRVMLAITGNGDTITGYLYNEGGTLIGSASAIESRGTDSNGHLVGMGGDGMYVAGFMDATAVSTTNEWTQATIEDIVADTA